MQEITITKEDKEKFMAFNARDEKLNSEILELKIEANQHWLAIRKQYGPRSYKWDKWQKKLFSLSDEEENQAQHQNLNRPPGR